MSKDTKFDPGKIDKLNRPERLQFQNPDDIWEILQLDHPKTLVDIGAGTGFFAMPFSEKMHQGRVYACDISDTMISWMKETIPEKYRGAVIPTKMEESEVPLPDGIADLVYMIDVYHELEEPAKMLLEARRLLRKGGKLMIVDWKKQETPGGPPLHHRVAAQVIASHMAEGGFVDIVSHEVLPYHCFLVGSKA
jgi:ubiquinone/menaquinone biosynthesis C-methylase UbiE